jgi:hypothetical protein
MYKILHIPNHRHISCEITNIIFLISCSKCGLQYVGETGRRAQDRLYEHLYSIKQTNKVTTPVSTHFSTTDHTNKDLTFQVIERGPTLSDTEEISRSRKSTEIDHPRWHQPHGIGSRPHLPGPFNFYSTFRGLEFYTKPCYISS